MKLPARLPDNIRFRIFHGIPKFIKLRIPLLRHGKIRKAAQVLGWKGEPLIGVAFQPEQQMNLDHIASCGAAIRVPFDQWAAGNLAKAVRKILADGNYKVNAAKLKNQMALMDGKKNSAEAILGKIRELLAESPPSR